MSETIEWISSAENDMGIKKVGIERLKGDFLGVTRILGYNGILAGSKIKYQGKEYDVEEISQFGYLILSKTEGMTHRISISPKEIDE